jgi:hypothetical protein
MKKWYVADIDGAAWIDAETVAYHAKIWQVTRRLAAKRIAKTELESADPGNVFTATEVR